MFYLRVRADWGFLYKRTICLYLYLLCYVLISFRFTWSYSQNVQVYNFSVEGSSNFYFYLSFLRPMWNWVSSWRARVSRVICRWQKDGRLTTWAATPRLATGNLLTSPIWLSRVSFSSAREWTLVRKEADMKCKYVWKSENLDSEQSSWLEAIYGPFSSLTAPRGTPKCVKWNRIWRECQSMLLTVRFFLQVNLFLTRDI